MMRNNDVDWPAEVKPLLAMYAHRKHPLEYRNKYELLVMVVLSARDSDANINKLAPAFFDAFPNLASLAKASADSLLPFLEKVRGHRKKINWLLEIASTVGDDRNIPSSMSGLTELNGIGRKSANVILRESGMPAQGIMVDLHVIRVVNRLGISDATTGLKMEKDLMNIFPETQWADLGMSLSFLGRETCRPSNPHHEECIMRNVCAFCRRKAGDQS